MSLQKQYDELRQLHAEKYKRYCELRKQRQAIERTFRQAKHDAMVSNQQVKLFEMRVKHAQEEKVILDSMERADDVGARNPEPEGADAGTG